MPGAIGLFRRDVLEEVYRRHPRMEGPTSEGAVEGPFERDTFAEDFDLSLTVLARGGRVVYEPEAVSNTKGPEGLFALVSQRYRWCRGTIQVLHKYLGRSRHEPQTLHPRLILWLAGTYFYDMLLVPLLFFTGLVLMSAGMIRGQGDPILLLAGLVPFLLLNATAAALFTTMHKDDMGILKYCLIYDLYHALIFISVWGIAVFDEVRGSRMRW
jgi:cellulose synthase/poly-beta-1,6-N-acetylglucosamine synthase-like glycosyltransferase